MRFLIDRCAGRRLADWLHEQGHDVLGAWDLGEDPGDRALLELAAEDDRVLVTIDTDFGELVYVQAVAHAGLVRLPDVPVARRVALINALLTQYRGALEARAVITIRGERVRVSWRSFP